MLDLQLEPLVVFLTTAHVYSAVLFIVVACRRSRLLADRSFWPRKYYLLMGWAPASVLMLGLLCDWRYWAFALASAVVGVVGESVLSWLWLRFFDEPLWSYSYEARLGGFTSTINVLPWMIGAFLFVTTGRLLASASMPSVTTSVVPEVVCAAVLPVGAVAAWVAVRALSARGGHRRFTRTRFAIFCAPIVATAVALTLWSDPRLALLMLPFALVGAVTEYAYGRTMALFFERSLWTYHPWKLDQGHSSVVALPLWALGGLTFYLLGLRLGIR